VRPCEPARELRARARDGARARRDGGPPRLRRGVERQDVEGPGVVGADQRGAGRSGEGRRVERGWGDGALRRVAGGCAVDEERLAGGAGCGVVAQGEAGRGDLLRGVEALLRTPGRQAAPRFVRGQDRLLDVLGATDFREPVIVLDSGANVDCSVKELLQFAWLGDVYAECVFGRSTPSIGLLSLGDAAEKGNAVVKEANAAFQNDGLHFPGTVEARQGDDVPGPPRTTHARGKRTDPVGRPEVLERAFPAPPGRPSPAHSALRQST